MFLKNKVAQIIALIFVQDYPNQWPHFFNDLLSSLDSGSEHVDQYLRVLLAVDTEVWSFELRQEYHNPSFLESL
jgi:exportin-T